MHHDDDDDNDYDYAKDHDYYEENDIMHLYHDDDYVKDHNDSEKENGTSFPRVLGSLLTKEARLITEEGTILT